MIAKGMGGKGGEGRATNWKRGGKGESLTATGDCTKYMKIASL